MTYYSSKFLENESQSTEVMVRDSQGRSKNRMRPIFILGITPRSGTNFLYNLLISHPDCTKSGHNGEDNLLSNIDLLGNFIDTVADSWFDKWGDLDEFRRRLTESLSDGLIDYLKSPDDKKPFITKTSNTLNIDKFYVYFPQAYLIIITRNGRDVVESGVKSFGWTYEQGFRMWADSVKRIIDFKKKFENSLESFYIIKYEDLCKNMESELKKILSFCELDVDRFDFEKAKNLPVFGSSSLRDGTKKMHWNPVEKSKDFNPLKRSANWKKSRHYRYNRVCGEYAPALGYNVLHSNKNLSYYLTNIILEVVALIVSSNLFQKVEEILKKLKNRTSNTEHN